MGAPRRIVFIEKTATSMIAMIVGITSSMRICGCRTSVNTVMCTTAEVSMSRPGSLRARAGRWDWVRRRWARSVPPMR
jgi:hypothetical protein